MSGSERGRLGSNGAGNARNGNPQHVGHGKPKRPTKTTAIVPIYERLPKGPHSIGATGVARNQRIRMYGGMIEAVATRGYARTSVRLVIGLAGVSRRVFYEQFSGKEECFLATFDVIVKRAIQRLTHAHRTVPDDPEKRLRVALEALGAELEQNPKALYLVLVDAQTAGPEGVRRLRQVTALCEARLSSVLSDFDWGCPTAGSADGPPAERQAGRSDALPLPVVRAIVGGLRRVTSARLHDGETADLGPLTGELVKWALLFSAPAVAALRPRPCTSLPFPETAALEPGACGGEGSRARLLRSAIELRVREGKQEEFSSLRIADGARLPVEAFIDLFPDPEACYLEALDVLGDEVLQLVADPGLVSAEWPDAVCRTVARLLAYLGSSPVRLRTLTVKAFEAGPPAIANIGALAYEVATLLTEGAPRRPRTRIAVEGVAGALWQVLACEVLAGRGHRLPVLTEYVSYVVLTPFVGPQEAAEAIVRSRGGSASPSNGTPAVNGTLSSNGTHAVNGTSSPNGTYAVNGTRASDGAHAADAAPSTNGAHAATGTNGSAPAAEDYRRLAERRSAKCVNTTPTSTDNTITTIKGA